MSLTSTSVSFSLSGGLWSLIAVPCVGLVVTLWPKRHGPVDHESRVSLVRRLTAFVIDLYVAMLIIMPFPVLLGLTTEAIVTGSWAWSYERDYFRPSDIISVAALLLSFLSFYFYFAWHFEKRRQTVGQNLLAFKLIPSTDQPRMSVRAFIAWINLAWWPTWPWTLFGRRQDYWWDNASGIVARRVERKSSG